MIERKGPALSAPAQAVEGFAKSCGVDINALDKREFKGTDYYFFTQEKKGSKTQDLLENIVDTAIKNIPIARPMHWGDLDFNLDLAKPSTACAGALRAGPLRSIIWSSC
jgi:glycyl-tRNA synthetase beta chain